MAMIARVFGCAACDGRALARWELRAGVDGVVNGGWDFAALLIGTKVNWGLDQIRFGPYLQPNLKRSRGWMLDSSRRLRRLGEGYDGCRTIGRGFGCLLVSYSPL